MLIYEVRWVSTHRGVDLISEALPFRSGCGTGELNAGRGSNRPFYAAIPRMTQPIRLPRQEDLIFYKTWNFLLDLSFGNGQHPPHGRSPLRTAKILLEP